MRIQRAAISLLSATVGLAIFPSYLWAYRLASASGAPTINIGDTVLVNKAAYDVRVPYSDRVLAKINSPKRGDLVYARLPGVPVPGLKRVVGVPGETVEIRESRVAINGELLPFQPLPRRDFDWVAPRNGIGTIVGMEDGHWISFTPGGGRDRNHPPVHLGAGQYFLVGDNRDNSLDSRVWGPIAEDRIYGRAWIIHSARN